MKELIKNNCRLIRLMMSNNLKTLLVYLLFVFSIFVNSASEVYLIKELFLFGMNKGNIVFVMEIVIIIGIFRILQKYCEIQLEKNNYKLSLHLKKQAYYLQQKIDYCSLKSQDVQNKIEMTKRLFDDNIINIIMNNLLTQISQIVRIITYAMVLMYIAPFILLFFVILCIIQWLIYRKNIDNQLIKLRKEREIFRKEHYFEYVVQELSYAQDIRMNKMDQIMVEEGKNANNEMLEMTMKYFVYNQIKINISLYFVEYSQFILAVLSSYMLLKFEIINFGVFIMLLKVNFDMVLSLRNFIKTLFNTILFNQMLSDYFSSVTLFESLSSQNKETLSNVNQISIENMKVEVNGNILLDEINVLFKKGKKYAIVGRNGSGKTTLLHAILGLQSYTGVIKYDEGNLNKLDISNVVSVLFQKFHYYKIGLKQNIMTAEPFLKKKYMDVIYKFKLDNLNEEKEEASLGQKQRISIARTLYKNADVFILDELNSALDPIIEKDIFRNVLSSCEDKILIIVAHKLKYITDCDEILFLENGKILSRGSHEYLLNNSKEYAELFYSQI